MYLLISRLRIWDAALLVMFATVSGSARTATDEYHHSSASWMACCSVVAGYFPLYQFHQQQSQHNDMKDVEDENDNDMISYYIKLMIKQCLHSTPCLIEYDVSRWVIIRWPQKALKTRSYIIMILIKWNFVDICGS